MSWCYYGDLRRKVGAMLRHAMLPPVVLSHRLPKGNVLRFVTVAGREGGKATLHVWSSPHGQPVGPRYTVDVVVADEDPSWVVERS